MSEISKTEALVLLIVSCGLFALFTYATFKFAVWIFKKLNENR
jgi:small neutral amino acid transporter SnatA (MarC family)